MKKMCLLIPALIGCMQGIGVTEPPDLAFKVSGDGTYIFDTGVLRGVLRSKERSVGLLSLEHIPSGCHLDGNEYGIFSHYRVFTAGKRYGVGAWDWPGVSTLNPDGSVEVRWPAADGRPFTLKALYRFSAPDTLDLTTSVTARETLRRFESFLASYFSESFPDTFMCGGPDNAPVFQTTELEKGYWQAFPCNAGASAIIQDGRWNIEPNPVDWVLRDKAPRPLALRRDTKTGVCAVVMAPPEDCFAVMTPYAGEGHRSLYLSLFGKDIQPGETASARARLVVRPLNKNEEAIALYAAYQDNSGRDQNGASLSVECQ